MTPGRIFEALLRIAYKNLYIKYIFYIQYVFVCQLNLYFIMKRQFVVIPFFSFLARVHHKKKNYLMHVFYVWCYTKASYISHRF